MSLIDTFEENDWFDTFTDEVNRLLVGGNYPPITISAKDNRFLIRAELPGVKAQALNVTVAEQTLTIQGERHIAPPAGAAFVHRERNDGSFNRTIALPRDIDNSKTESVLSNGILTITLHKRKETEPKKISVKAG
ncbi:MAG: Hsp20/alpha crystallin family protein [Thermodesulfobacteriota bacterium]